MYEKIKLPFAKGSFCVIGLENNILRQQKRVCYTHLKCKLFVVI